VKKHCVAQVANNVLQRVHIMALRTFSLSRRFGWAAALRGGAGSTIYLLRAGQALRITRGRDRSGNRDMPLHDLSDFHFADGSPAEITPTQQKWMRERENIRLRQEKIESEMIALHSFWSEKDRQANEELEKQKEEQRQAKEDRKKIIRELADKKRDEILARAEADRKKREKEAAQEKSPPVETLVVRQRKALQAEVEKNFREGKPKDPLRIKEEEKDDFDVDDIGDDGFDSFRKKETKSIKAAKKKKKGKGVPAPVSPKDKASSSEE